jgi:hypothetical protein
MDKEYRIVFIDSSNSIKSKLNPKINGDNMAREMEAAMNELYAQGYVFEREILIDAHINLVKEGYMLVFRKEKK